MCVLSSQSAGRRGAGHWILVPHLSNIFNIKDLAFLDLKVLVAAALAFGYLYVSSRSGDAKDPV